ncbi:DUF3501 family protein [Shewanella submarina]|uniref:DUF3501 family protein n=1 Tax=Shewanella submarina TaxID=2016376 RepID=A0ABV7GBH0_9GAMM|nr:DUF3501 family protein [Shewanella submarina]MCL1036602.1 DUF3501 family protein [Shewanella submarina]
MLTREDLWSLEEYAVRRNDFRARVMDHKRHRHITIGDHVRLLFEDKITIQYQIQEMLRVERIFEAEGIQEELDAYNPLIPNGSNLKATLMFEYTDVEQRKRMLALLKGAEHKVWLKVAEHPQVFAIADEDLERENDEKTSSVHFLRFELSDADIHGLKSGEELMIGIDTHHVQPNFTLVDNAGRQALSEDLEARLFQ